jgi:hypothetical protein
MPVELWAVNLRAGRPEASLVYLASFLAQHKKPSRWFFGLVVLCWPIRVQCLFLAIDSPMTIFDGHLVALDRSCLDFGLNLYLYFCVRSRAESR